MSLPDPLDELALVVCRVTPFLMAYEAHGVVRGVSATCRNAVAMAGVLSHGQEPGVTLLRSGCIRRRGGCIQYFPRTYVRTTTCSWSVTDACDRTDTSDYMVIGTKGVTMRTYGTDVVSFTAADVWDRRDRRERRTTGTLTGTLSTLSPHILSTYDTCDSWTCAEQ